MTTNLVNADAIQWAKDYEGELFHSILCDPPYHLTTITKRFGKNGSAPAKFGTDGVYQRASAGFMNQKWDGGDIAFQPETWEAFYNILHPGAFGMAFGGSRTAHRMAVAIEDAGFIIHPQMSWVYSTGFPKATRVRYNCNCGRKEISKHDLRPVRETNLPQTKSVEKAKGETLQPSLPEHSIRLSVKGVVSKQGNEDGKESGVEGGSNLPQSQGELPSIQNKIREMSSGISADGKKRQVCDGTQIDNSEDVGKTTEKNRDSSPYRPQSREQQSGKPGVVADQCRPQERGTGEICSRCSKPIVESNPFEGHRYGLQALKPASEPIIVFQKPYKGRPIDSITETGAGALNIDGGRIGNERLAEQKAGQAKIGTFERENMVTPERNGRWPANFVLTHSPQCEMIGYRDSDSYQINRFTDGAKPFGDAVGEAFETEEIEGGRVPAWECVEGCPVLALDKQSGHTGSSARPKSKGKEYPTERQVYSSGGMVTHNSMHNDSGGASRFFHQSHWAIENADPFVYNAKVSVSERNKGLGGERCGHPTMKPIALIKHLATLLLPPKEYAPRRIAIPFAGVGSECIGSFMAGWDEIVGIEMEAEYAEIGRARIEYWLKQGVQLDLW